MSAFLRRYVALTLRKCSSCGATGDWSLKLAQPPHRSVDRIWICP